MIKGTFVRETIPTGVDADDCKTFARGSIDLSKTEVRITQGTLYSSDEVTELLDLLGVRVVEDTDHGART